MSTKTSNDDFFVLPLTCQKKMKKIGKLYFWPVDQHPWTQNYQAFSCYPRVTLPYFSKKKSTIKRNNKNRKILPWRLEAPKVGKERNVLARLYPAAFLVYEEKKRKNDDIQHIPLFPIVGRSSWQSKNKLIRPDIRSFSAVLFRFRQHFWKFKDTHLDTLITEIKKVQKLNICQSIKTSVQAAKKTQRKKILKNESKSSKKKHVYFSTSNSKSD